jgi:hypothetical protein
MVLHSSCRIDCADKKGKPPAPNACVKRMKNRNMYYFLKFQTRAVREKRFILHYLETALRNLRKLVMAS